MRLLHASLLLAAVSIAGRALAGEPGPVPPPPPAEDKAKGPEHNVTLTEEPGVLELLNKAQKARARAEKDAEVWPEVVKFYSEILKKYPNTVYLDRWEGPDKTEMAWKNGLYKSTRERVARDIASLPPGGLATYRVINDPAARNLFLEAQDQFDERKMEQVAQEFFPTSFGDDAMAWLAEISHDRGAARQAVLRLDQALKHPSPTIPKTAALARIVLSYADMGQRPAAEKALADLEQAVTDPKNGALRLGHSEGAEALAKLKDRVSKIAEKKTATPANPATGGGWETYFGNAAHNRFLPTRKNVGLRKWSVPINQLLEGPGADTSGASKILNADGTPIIDPTMNYHLVSKDGYFYLCNANSIAAYPTGNPQPGLSSAGGNVKFFFPNDAQPTAKPKESNKDRVMRARFGRMAGAGVRHHPYFVTLAGDRLYAVLGAEANTLDPDMWRGQEVKQQANYLVSLGYQSGKLIWSLQPDVRSQFFDSHSKADQEWLKTVFFASAPVYESGVLYVLAVQSHGLNDAWAAAFDADNGRLLWRTQICSANAYTVGGPVQPDLALPVAVANGTVYAVTNLGAVAAIDAMSGNIKWLRVYDRQQVVDRFNNRGMRVASDFWGPNAPVVHENLLIVTPQDSDFLYAYDIETGKRVWEISRTEREGSNLKHILGISNGALVVTGQNIQFFQMKGGAALGDANNPILFDSPIKGRGIVTDNMVLIPTEKALVSIDTTLDNTKFRPKVSKVTPWTQPEVEAGNLVIAGDVLYSVSRTHVNAYFVWEEMEARLKDRIKKDANDLGAYSELADVYHKVDKFDLALAELDKALELVAKQKDDPKAAATKEELLRKKFDALYAQGDKSQNKPVANKADLTAAYDWYKQAYGVANGPVLPPALAVKALRAMAENAFLQMDKKLAVDHYQHIITDHGEVVYNYQADSSSKARLFAQARIAEIRKTNPEAYEKQDADAKAAFAKAGNDIKQLEAVLATWPNSNTCGAAMLKLAHLAIASSPDQARQYALTFLGRYPATPDTANANVLLAVAYEKSNLLGPAKDVLRRLSGRKELAEQPVTIDPAKPGENLAAPVKAAEWATKRLAEPQFQRTPSAATMSLGDGKLKQVWTRPANAQSVPVLARGIAPYDMRKNLFYVENASELAVLSSSDRGEEIWTPRPKLPIEVLPKPNQQDPQRFAMYQNVMGPQAVWSERLLIFVGAREVVAYDSREKGKVVWRTDLKLPSPQQRCAIQVSYGRLVIGYPSGALCVLDAATGEQLWQTQVEGNQLTGVPTAGDGFVAVAAQNPARVYLYDLETGNRRGAIDVAAGSLTVQPEALGDRLFFAERNMLKAIDGNSGKLVWEKDCGGNITRLEAERELVATVIDGRRVAAVTIEQQGESKLWSPVLERDVTIRDLYIDGDDLYVVFTSPDRRSGLSSHSVRLQGKKQWEAELSTAQLDALQIGPATVGANHLMVTQSNWDPTGDKPAAVVLIDRKTGKLTWAESLGSEHRTLDADNMAHPAFTAQMFDGGVVITESKKRSAFTVPDQVNIDDTIKSLQEQLAKKTDDIGLRARLALKQYEKGSVDEAMKNLAEALGNKAITDEQFTTTFADFSRLRAEISRKQKRTFNFVKIADASKLDAVPETVLSSWRDIYFPSDDETSGAIKKNLWNGPDDLKVSFRGGWDDKNLYLLFTVTDDKHKNEQTDGTYCDVGDSVKVAFDIDRDGGMGYRGEDFAFGAAFSEKAPTPVLGWRWVEHGQYLSGATPLAPLPEVKRKDAEKQTLYKMTIPLTYLTLKPETGKKFGFSFVVNDQDDGAAVTKSIGASPGLVGAPFPGLFAEGVLLEK
jgi:outer membrane protein assembly factor BamB/tetratricopeptide (TPR) repeat protein